MLQKQRMICTSTYRCALYILTAPFIDSPSMVGVKEGRGCYDWRIEKVQYEDAFDTRGWRRKMKYYRGLDTERYNFYRIPKVLVTDRRFRKLSSDSKMLYGIMLDRMTLYSKKNNWIDQDDHAYIIFPVVEMASELECSKRKIQMLLTELESYGMIERKRIGLGQANYIYLYNFFEDMEKETVKIQKEIKRESKGSKNLLTPEQWREKFLDQIEYQILEHDHPEWKNFIDNIVDIMLSVVLSRSTTVKVNGTECDKRTVIRQFCKLNRSHIEYVIQTLMQVTETNEIGNIRSYLITALYNAPSTMHMYYSLKVNHDLYNRSPEMQDHTYPEVQGYAHAEVQRYADPEVQEFAHAEVSRYADPEMQELAHTEVQDCADPEMQKFAHPKAQRQVDPEMQTFAHAETQRYTVPEVRKLAHAEVPDYADSDGKEFK